MQPDVGCPKVAEGAVLKKNKSAPLCCGVVQVSTPGRVGLGWLRCLGGLVRLMGWLVVPLGQVLLAKIGLADLTASGNLVNTGGVME